MRRPRDLSNYNYCSYEKNFKVPVMKAVE
jgi:hypothetical protein